MPPLLITRWTTRAAAPRAPLDGRSRDALLAEVLHFSEALRYFEGEDVESGTWLDLLLRREGGGSGGAPPHVALLLAFLELFEESQAALNRLPQRLESSYREFLGDDEAAMGPPAPRHRGRAILPEDYERLLLQAFPQIERVRALAARDSTGAAAPGTVLLLLDGAPADVARRVEDWLPSVASPAARIEVAAPQPCRIDVRLEAELVPGGAAEAIEEDVRAFLDGRGEAAVALSDEPTQAALRDALSRFVGAHPAVHTLDDLEITVEATHGASRAQAGTIRVETAVREEE
jgi:hypothetical protein